MKNQLPKIKLERGKNFLHIIQRTGFPHLMWATRFIDNYFGHISTSPRGARTIISDIKTVRLQYTSWLSETRPIYNSSAITQLDHEFPKLLQKGGVPLTREVTAVKFTLSVLCFTRSFKLPVIPNLGVIEDQPNVDEEFLREFRDFAAVALKPGMKELAGKLEGNECHFSTKSGPNGQAMYSSFEDLKHLTPSQKEDIGVIGGQNILDLLSKIGSYDSSLEMSPFDLINKRYPVVKSKNTTRRMVFISDKEGKTRTIGVLDYGSQTVLKLIHDRLNLILKKLKCDRTFSQDKPVGNLREGQEYLSADLKAATDSFPIEIQEIIVEALGGSTISKSGRRLMTETPFKVSNRSNPVYYKRGQPMGAYSSGPVFALTHHVLVQYSAYKAGLKLPFTDYAVLGDDVVITNTLAGNSYLETLKLADIPISIEKTMWSKTTYEFAKRWFINGEEVSPFPVSGLFESAKYYHTLHNLLDTANRKGYPCFGSEGPNRELVTHIGKVLGKYEQSLRLYKKFQIFNALSSRDPDVLKTELQSIYPEGKGDNNRELITQGKLLLLWDDLFKLQEFYNKELDALKKGHVVELYKKLKKNEDDQAAPAYEYADVGPPMSVARRLIRVYLRSLDKILKNHKEECQLDDESLIQALLVNEVPSFVISRRVLNERTHRKKLGARARLVSMVMDLWNDSVKTVDLKFLSQRFGVVIELDFDEGDECMGRVVLEPMEVREARLVRRSSIET